MNRELVASRSAGNPRCAHAGPVFPLDMSVVVFFIRAATSELDLLLIAEGFEVIVKELRTVGSGTDRESWF